MSATLQDCEDQHLSFRTNCVVNAFLCFTSITLNCITIHALRKTLSLQKPLRTLLLSLAVSDLGTGLITQPLYVALLGIALEQCTKDNRNFDMVYKGFIITLNLFSIATYAGVMALTVDRFLSIHLHLRYGELVTQTRVIAVAIFNWLLAAFLSFLRLLIPRKISYGIFAIIKASCLIIATTLYFKIYRTVRRHARQIHSQHVRQETGNSPREDAARMRKFVTGTFFVYLTFLLCYLPSVGTLMAVAITGQSKTTEIWRSYTLTLLLLNSSLNPLIYCWKMRQIRHTVMEILRHPLRCCRPEIGQT